MITLIFKNLTIFINSKPFKNHEEVFWHFTNHRSSYLLCLLRQGNQPLRGGQRQS